MVTDMSIENEKAGAVEPIVMRSVQSVVHRNNAIGRDVYDCTLSCGHIVTAAKKKRKTPPVKLGCPICKTVSK